MKYWVIITLHTLSFASFAQNEPIEKRPFHLGYFYSADYTRGAFDGSYGYSTGLNLLKGISPKFRMDLGLHFSSIGDHRENLTLGSAINPSTGTFDTTFTLRQKYQFIELPVRVNYFLAQKRKINIFLLAGISPNYFLRTRTAYDNYPSGGGEIKGETYTNKNVSYSIIGVSGIIGFGIEIKIHERLTLNFQPEYRYYFASNRLTAVGLNSGIIVKL